MWGGVLMTVLLSFCFFDFWLIAQPGKFAPGQKLWFPRLLCKSCCFLVLLNTSPMGMCSLYWADKDYQELMMSTKYLVAQSFWFFFRLGEKYSRKEITGTSIVSVLLKSSQWKCTLHLSFSSISVGSRLTLTSKTAQAALLCQHFSKLSRLRKWFSISGTQHKNPKSLWTLRISSSGHKAGHLLPLFIDRIERVVQGSTESL